MRECLTQQYGLVEDSAAATKVARQFYELVAVASKNLVLGFLVNALHRMSENATVAYSADHWRGSIKQAEKMLQAIENGDAESAQAISAKVHDTAIRYWEKNFPDLLNQPVSWVTS